LYCTTSGIITPIGASSASCASSWLITKINILLYVNVTKRGRSPT